MQIEQKKMINFVEDSLRNREENDRSSANRKLKLLTTICIREKIYINSGDIGFQITE